MSRKTKRGILEGDYHSGHWGGLTPPDFFANPSSENPTIQRHYQAQSELWRWRYETLKEIGPVDFHGLNADLIDGRGEKSGSTELQIVDRNMQVNAAIQAAKLVKLSKGGKRVMTYGTPYHTGQHEDFEDIIAEALGCPVDDRVFFEVNGVTFDMRHKVGSSSVPYGRATQIAKQKVWNALLAGDGAHANGQPKADFIVRSHVHYHFLVGQADWVAMTLPCLQYPGSKFGARQCDGEVTMGMMYVEITPAGNYSWRPLTCQPAAAKAQTVQL